MAGFRREGHIYKLLYLSHHLEDVIIDITTTTTTMCKFIHR